MDQTGRRILAYLASVEPLDAGAVLPAYHKGRSVIEHMALSARGASDPGLRLSVDDCANVLYFVQLSVPIEPRTWWEDPKGTPSQIVGFTMVVGAVEKALRERRS
jgi:hypothetical protein